MKLTLIDRKLARRALRVLTAIGCLLTAGVSLGEPPSMLTYAWRAEATRPAEVAVTIRQGETLRLACTLLERAKPIAVPDDATSRFFWRDADAKGNYWAQEATRQGSELAFVWSAACDVGAKRYDFVLSLESPTAGTLYRASGLLIMQSSPGFNPASLQPPDVFAEIVEAAKAAVLEVAATQADLQAEAKTRAEADTALQGALSAEADARAETDGAITEAVNALQGNLADHNHDGAYLKLTGGTMSGTILSALSKASDPGLTITLGKGDRYYAKHTQAGIQARRALSEPEEFYAFFSVSGTNQIARLGDLEPLATKAALAAKANLSHTHEMGDVDGLETALASKAALSHTHSQYLTAESDPTISAWAKAATKPTYNWAEILNKPTAFPPATHNHDGTYLKLTGGTVTGNVTFKGSSNYMEKLEFGGSAAAAGLMTRGISGRNHSNAPGGTKDSLFLNYDGYTIPHSTYWKYECDNSRGVFVCGAEPSALVVRRIDLETILKGYAAKSHSHAINEVTNLQAALNSLAPLSSVTCTTNAVTYIWQWDEAAGTFALVERE